MVFDRCRDVLLEESDLVQKIAQLQNIVWDAVMNRDWTDFEAHFDTLNELGDKFITLEAERERIFSEIAPDSDTSAPFYTYVSHLPASDRKELCDIYRNLKLESLKVQVFNETLMGYIAGARATLAGFFEIAFPDRGGKLYTPHGIPVSHDMRSMVLNRCF